MLFVVNLCEGQRVVMNEQDLFTIVFNSLDPSDAVRQRALALLTKLLRTSPSIMRGTMVIEGRHRHHHQGNLFHVSVRLQVPGVDVVVSHDPERNHAHEDIFVAMRDACEAARKQLEAYESRRGGKARQHEQERFLNRPEQQAE